METEVEMQKRDLLGDETRFDINKQQRRVMEGIFAPAARW